MQKVFAENERWTELQLQKAPAVPPEISASSSISEVANCPCELTHSGTASERAKEQTDASECVGGEASRGSRREEGGFKDFSENVVTGNDVWSGASTEFK
jgi:hypothetical protein